MKTAEKPMIETSMQELSQDGKYNKYTLVIAASKCARMVTDEYVRQREYAEKLIATKSTDKSLVALIKREYRDDKALKIAVNRITGGEFKIIGPDETREEPVAEAEAEAEASEE